MDPDTTWALITDESNDPRVRAGAAVDMLEWLVTGGYLPGGDRKQTIGQRNKVLDACTAAINHVLDERDTPVGWARPNGAGEIVFRQAGHPKNDEAINAEEPWAGMWRPVYLGDVA